MRISSKVAHMRRSFRGSRCLRTGSSLSDGVLTSFKKRVSGCSVWRERVRFHRMPEEFRLQGNKNLWTLFGTRHLKSFQCDIAALSGMWWLRLSSWNLRESTWTQIRIGFFLTQFSLAAGWPTASYSRLRISCLNIPEKCTGVFLGNLSNRQNTEKNRFCVLRWPRKERGTGPNAFSTAPSVYCLLELTSDAEEDNTSEQDSGLLTRFTDISMITEELATGN